MKQILNLFLLLLLASCAPARSVVALPGATSTVIVPPESTATFASPSPTSAPTEIPCDPLAVDFCITDGHFILQRPINPSANDSVDSTYPYASTANGTRDPHHGVEFLNKFGTPIQAAADGVVVFAGSDEAALYSPRINFYGNFVVLRHADDLFTLYAHLSVIHVQRGDEVKAGEQIGDVGQSGAATGSHLHFEVREGNGMDYLSTQNPELWLIPERDERNLQYGTLMISVMDELSHYQFADLTVTRYPRFSDAPEKAFYVETYVKEMAVGAENAALSGLQAGRYRIALKLNGHLYERWVEVKSGKLTQTIIVVQ